MGNSLKFHELVERCAINLVRQRNAPAQQQLTDDFFRSFRLDIDSWIYKNFKQSTQLG